MGRKECHQKETDQERFLPYPIRMTQFLSKAMSCNGISAMTQKAYKRIPICGNRESMKNGKFFFFFKLTEPQQFNLLLISSHRFCCNFPFLLEDPVLFLLSLVKRAALLSPCAVVRV